MDIMNQGTEDGRYKDLNASSTDEERISVFLDVLVSSETPEYALPDKLYFKNEPAFNAKLQETGFVDSFSTKMYGYPGYRMNGEGFLMIDACGSYLNYIAQRKRQGEVQKQRDEIVRNQDSTIKYLTIEDFERRTRDYKKAERRADISMQVSVVAAILAAIALFMQWMAS